MAWLLKQTPWKRVALHPEALHTLCENLLHAHGVKQWCVAPEQFLQWRLTQDDTAAMPYVKIPTDLDGQEVLLCARYWVDTTPDGSFLQAQGLPAVQGLGNLWGTSVAHNALGISPMPCLHGLTGEALISWEKAMRVRHADTLPTLLDKALPYHPTLLKEAYLTRDCFMPLDPDPEADYIDMLNPSIGVLWHAWQQEQGILPETCPYQEAPWWVDGGNIARLGCSPHGGECLAWNGIVLRPESLEEALSISQGLRPVPERAFQAVDYFKRFIETTYAQLFGACPPLTMTLPPHMYVRNSVLFPCQTTVTGAGLFTGGVSAQEAIGWFSYWLDFRGIDLWKHLTLTHPLPKARFNVGLGQTQPLGLPSALQHAVFVVSRAAGASPLGQSVCRIVQHQCLLAEALGVALADSKGVTQGFANPVSQAQAVRHTLQARQSMWHVENTLTCERTLQDIAQASTHALPLALKPYDLQDKRIMGIVDKV
jgi:hypothetical protein